ncbi:MAG: tetratricopeptide repeat protein [Bryobacteraceae bacterium]|nr:tetratricopeptide repeat protein [Bryobacteraceae bacterium]
MAERYYREGIELFEKKKYAEAALAFRKAIQKSPQWGEPYYRLALCDLESGGDINRAFQALRQAMSLMPENEDVKVRLAGLYIVAYLQHGAIEDMPLKMAREISESLLKRKPDSFEGQMLAGQVALLENKRKDALVWFEKARAQKQDSALAIASIGITQAGLGQEAEAEQNLRKALDLDPRLGPAWDALYLAMVRQKRIADAEAVCRLRMEKNPKDPVGRLMLASHFFRHQKPKEMEAALEPMLRPDGGYENGKLIAGDFYRSIGRLADARALYESGLKESAANASLKTEYRKRLASLLLLEGKRDEAEKAYADVLEDAPKDPESRARRALLLLDRDAAAALKEFQQLAKDVPGNPVIRYNLGLALLANRKQEEARTAFLEAARMQRNYLEPRLALAQMAMDREQWRELQQTAADVLTINPRHPEGRYFRAAAYTGLGNYEESRKILLELLKEFPNYREAHLQMAYLDLAEKRFAAAESRLKDLYEKTRDVRALNGRVEVELAQNRQKEALALAQAELAKNPEDARIRLLVARTALRVADYPLAARELIRLAERDPNWDYIYLLLGQAHQLNGDLQRAILAFQRALQITPNSLEATLRLAYAHETAGQIREAISAYRKALEINPNTPIAMNNLAYLLSEHGGDLDEAQKLAQLALQRLPQQQYIADTLGWVFYKKNDLDSALQIFQNLVRKYPEEPAFRYHLGAVLLKKGQKAQARAELQAALQSKPPSDMEKKIRELLSQAS